MQNRKDRVENTFPYQLLSRLEQDCKYFLGAGNGYEGHLWAGDVEAQIKKMKDLYDRLPETPEWITMEDIENYEKEMLALRDRNQKNEDVCKDYKVINHTDDELDILEEDFDDEPYYYDPEEDFGLFKDYDGDIEFDEATGKYEQFIKIPEQIVNLVEDGELEEEDIVAFVQDNLGNDYEINYVEATEDRDASISIITDTEELNSIDWSVFEYDPHHEYAGWESLDYNKLREELEENEDEVECQGCFETFNKADCVKGEHGYYCKECASLHESKEESAGVHVGDTIKIISMDGEPQYTGKQGTVKDIDDIGQIHGTWGGCAIIPEVDEFEIVGKATNKALTESVSPMEFFKKVIDRNKGDQTALKRIVEDPYYIDEIAIGRYSIAEVSDEEMAEIQEYAKSKLK